MASPIPMPMRNERVAAKFDTSRARELPRYFEDLEQLLDRAQITDDIKKKKHAVRYTDFDTEQIWKSFPEFKSPSVPYEEFKKTILFHYPEASGDFFYSIGDMELLISERRREGITSARDLSDYHLEFLAITTWLIEKRQLGDPEQRRAYIRGFQAELLTAITDRLQIKNPDHHPSIPYQVTEVYEAARYILQGAPSFGFTSSTSPIPASSTPIDDVLTIQSIAPFLTEFTKTITEALKDSNSSPRYQSAAKPRMHTIDHHVIQELPVVPSVHRSITPTYSLTDDERIAAIEAELFSLRQLTPRIEEIYESDNTLKQPTISISTSQPIIPEYTYRNTEDTVYTLPFTEKIPTDSQQTFIHRSIDTEYTGPPIIETQPPFIQTGDDTESSKFPTSTTHYIELFKTST